MAMDGASTPARWRAELAATASLALPIALSNLAQIAISTTDVLMMGWLGAEKLAAGALASSLLIPAQYFALGVASAISAIIAQALGARQIRQVRRAVRQGLWAAVAISLPVGVMLWYGGDLLSLMGQDALAAQRAGAYLQVVLWGFLPSLGFVVLRGFIVALSRPRAALVVTVLAIALNALANYGLMFGHFGLPRLELVGAAIATVIVDVAMFAGLLGFVLWDRRLRRFHILLRLWRSDWPLFRSIFRLGLPIGLTALAEIGMFAASVFMMGLIGTVEVAAHGIAMQIAGIVFMVPMGIGNAATVRVGYAAGRRDPAGVGLAGWAALALGLAFALVAGTAVWLWGRGIIGLFLGPASATDAAAAAMAVTFLRFVALFQAVDCTQAIMAGALRGLKDTAIPMLLASAGYWLLGIGAATVLGFALGYGGEGIWAALAIGLASVAVMLTLRFRVAARRFARTA